MFCFDFIEELKMDEPNSEIWVKPFGIEGEILLLEIRLKLSCRQGNWVSKV